MRVGKELRRETAEASGKRRIDAGAFYKRKAKPGGIAVSGARKLRTLDNMDAMVTRLLADAERPARSSTRER